MKRDKDLEIEMLKCCGWAQGCDDRCLSCAAATIARLRASTEGERAAGFREGFEEAVGEMEVKLVAYPHTGRKLSRFEVLDMIRALRPSPALAPPTFHGVPIVVSGDLPMGYDAMLVGRVVDADGSARTTAAAIKNVARPPAEEAAPRCPECEGDGKCRCCLSELQHGCGFACSECNGTGRAPSAKEGA